MKQTYSFRAKVWLYEGDDPWHFVSLPQEIAKEIDYYFGHAKRGWGSLPVSVTVGKTIWQTSIFTDKKSASYLLPLKSEVRKKEGIEEGKLLNISLTVTS